MSIVPTRARYGAVLDANVLVPVALCDTLLRLAADQFYRPFWSEEILSETERALIDQLGISPRKASKRVDAMRQAFPDAVGKNVHIYQFGLPDPDDEHVLAAAVKSEAQAIVTFNARDFPSSVCGKEDIEVISPDDFLISQWDFDSERVRSVIYSQIGALRAPVQSMSNILFALTPHAPKFVACLAKSIAEDIRDFVDNLDLELRLTSGDEVNVEVPEHLQPLIDALNQAQ